MIRVAMIGCGDMARYHARQMLLQRETTQISVVCEPSPVSYAAFCEEFTGEGLDPPPNEPDLAVLLDHYKLDAAFIITPHVFHHDQTIACLEAGLDVLLEKPMVMNVQEAVSLISARDRTGRLLVVAFPGGLSPRIRKAVDLVRSGEIGRVVSISATLWQNWGQLAQGTWRQVPELSGGGFLIDTGAHMLNTVADLAGEEIVEVAAFMEDLDRPVDVLSVVVGRLATGGLVTLHACGETIESCTSDIRVFGTKAILQTSVWGRYLKLQRDGEPALRAVRVRRSLGVWEEFLSIRSGRLPNSCPPEVGLRMARLHGAITHSAGRNGAVVRL